MNTFILLFKLFSFQNATLLMCHNLNMINILHALYYLLYDFIIILLLIIKSTLNYNTQLNCVLFCNIYFNNDTYINYSTLNG